MNKYFEAILKSLPSTACIVGAAILALNGIEGWGWLLFIAALFEM